MNQHGRTCLLLVAIGVAPSEAGAAETNEAIIVEPAHRAVRQIEGWTVHVDKRLLADEHRELGDRTLRLLGCRLYEISLALPADKLQRLRQVPIYVDRTYGKLKSAQYHPSRDWLKNQGYDPGLAKSVHIPDASLFASSNHQWQQPWSVLHELAHAFHDQVLGFEHPEIKAAWQRVRDSGRFNSVLRINGRNDRHYALTNQMEFFAEMSESYFGTNDFYPFNRAELQHAEPEVFELMKQIWNGQQRPKNNAASASSSSAAAK